jgi:hypothetical protein
MTSNESTLAGRILLRVLMFGDNGRRFTLVFDPNLLDILRHYYGRPQSAGCQAIL